MDINIWVPLIVIFLSATIAAIVKRHTKDPCLKRCAGTFVYVKMKSGQWAWGDLLVYPNALELRYRSPEPFGNNHQKLSYVLYEQHLDAIERILRPSPAPGTPEQQQWAREVHRLQKPSALRSLQRRLRNLFNMLRDGFTQSISAIFGIAKQRTWLGKVPVADDKVSEVGKNLISIVPNAYEPVLEKYLGHRVVVESAATPKPREESGVLQEYSSKFVLVRDVDALLEPPPKTPMDDSFGQNFDVIYARSVSTVRHLAS